MSWTWLLGEWLNPVPSSALLSSSFLQSILQNKIKQGRSEVLWSAPQSPGFAGDLYFSFKTSVVIVGLLGFLFSVRTT